ncbi:cell wall metabolism sensor histidine kinase WalK [Eubacteriales bacterium OttesenSCG-928-N13]|nr:cell wall metabolism sensor histidine kinase WalK [Eubacteriales bacterium OttesenSCG-928-N13]
MVVLMIIMTALLTTGIYNFFARTAFTNIKENELRPKAYALSRVIEGYQNDELDLSGMLKSFTVEQASENLLGAYLVIVDANGGTFFTSGQLDHLGYKDSMVESARMVLEQGEMFTSQFPAFKHTSMVGVGVPVMMNDQVAGAVLMALPLQEALVSMLSLNWALVLSLMLSLPVMAIIEYYVVGRVVNPLRQMTGVASKMASGDFSQRADTSQRGEVGELGSALNYLSQELSLTISTLTLERNRLKQTINGLSEGIVAVDRLSRITHINPAIEKLFQTAPSDEQDERLRVISDENIWNDFHQVVTTGEPIQRPLELPDRILMINISPLHDEIGEIAGAVGQFTDITESERLERTRRDYVANVSHEMRTPLTAMRALVEPLSEGMVSDEETRKRYYAIMMRETMRLSRLIDDLMELSRLQSGSLLLSAQLVNLQEVFDEIEVKYEPVAEDRGVTFHQDASLGEVPEVLSNPDRVEQVLVILLDNAMKYTPEGGSVHLSATWDQDKVIISVADTGIGIDPADQPYVFDRFYKVDKAHSGLGSGLGLSIASELLRMMGEEIKLTSVPGEGSIFSFTLKRS